MDIYQTYHWSTSIYLTLQSLPLLLAPNLITSLLATEPRRPTDLEIYLCRSLALALLSLAAVSALLTGALPLSTTSTSTSISDDEASSTGGGASQQPKKPNPYAIPAGIVTTSYHALSAFYLYAQTTWRGFGFGFGAGLVLSSGLCSLGIWTLMFGGEAGRVSRRTGGDKRTGNYPFVNSESAREKKKESKRRSVGVGKGRL